jgi:hypothetical protein
MSDTPSTEPTESVEQEAEKLERKFGDLASTYAENRSEAAELRGAGDAAEHWAQVRDEVSSPDRDE